MVTDTPTFFDVALVKDDAATHLADAESGLARLRQALGTRLLELDVLFLDPSLLVSILHLDPSTADDALVRDLALKAREQGFRVLRPMLLSAAGRQQFYTERLSRFGFRALKVDSIASVFAALRTRLTQKLQAPGLTPTTANELRLGLRFADEATFLAEFGADTAGESGSLFIGCTATPNIGASLRIALELASGQGPIDLDAQVVAVRDPATAPGSPIGFDVALVLSSEQATHFESFLAAVKARRRWPEEYTRQYERFPIRLPVEFIFAGERQRAYAGNISLGGVFVETPTPPPYGATLRVRLFATARNAEVEIEGRVVHATGALEAVARGRKPGAGIQFTEPTSVVRERIERIIGSLEAPTYRRVMVVDDDRFFRVLLGNVLKLAGFEVMLAVDGNDAFHRLLDELLRLDLLVLDLCMPGMSGEELVEMVRSVGGEENLAVVVITGTDLTDLDRERIAKLGADEVIEKRVPPEQMLERIEATLKRRAERTSRR